MANIYRCLLLGFIIVRPLAAAPNQSLIDAAIQRGRLAEAEQLLNETLIRTPNDQEAMFRLAKVLSWQKKYDQAEMTYRALLATDASNTDYQLGICQVYVWRNQAALALPLLEQARKSAPGNPDIWRLQIQALVAQGAPASMQQAIVLRQQAAERFPDLDWPVLDQNAATAPVKPDRWAKTELERNIKASRATQLEVGGSYENLTNRQGHWRSEYLSFEHRFNPRQLIYGTVLQSERFAKNDVQLLLGTYQPVTANLIFNLEGDVSPTAQVLAKNSIMASLQGSLGHGAFVTGGYRHSEYGTGPLEQGFATLESYFSDFRVAYTVRATHSFQQTQFGHRFDFSYYYDDISSITFTYNFGAETGGFQGLVYDTQYFGLHGRHWLNPDWAVTWDLGHIEQGDAYLREGVMLGLRRAF